MQDYRQEIGSLQPGEARDVAFTFVQREDVPTARYTIRFLAASADGVLTEKKFYVNTTAKPEAEKPSGGQDGSGNEQQSIGGGSREAQTMIFYLLMQEDSVMEVHPTVAVPVEMVLYRG